MTNFFRKLSISALLIFYCATAAGCQRIEPEHIVVEGGPAGTETFVCTKAAKRG